jgi:hypothetical protein
VIWLKPDYHIALNPLAEANGNEKRQKKEKNCFYHCRHIYVTDLYKKEA